MWAWGEGRGGEEWSWLDFRVIVSLVLKGPRGRRGMGKGVCGHVNVVLWTCIPGGTKNGLCIEKHSTKKAKASDLGHQKIVDKLP